jgi:hypothetical protein
MNSNSAHNTCHILMHEDELQLQPAMIELAAAALLSSGHKHSHPTMMVTMGQ